VKSSCADMVHEIGANLGRFRYRSTKKWIPYYRLFKYGALQTFTITA
jgi:hypothetical protein